jgi:hypothetical protein
MKAACMEYELYTRGFGAIYKKMNTKHVGVCNKFINPGDLKYYSKCDIIDTVLLNMIINKYHNNKFDVIIKHQYRIAEYNYVYPLNLFHIIILRKNIKCEVNRDAVCIEWCSRIGTPIVSKIFVNKWQWPTWYQTFDIDTIFKYSDGDYDKLSVEEFDMISDCVDRYVERISGVISR